MEFPTIHENKDKNVQLSEVSVEIPNDSNTKIEDSGLIGLSTQSSLLQTVDTSSEQRQENKDFVEVPLSTGKKRKPKRVLHFSDGVLEEYSDDEEMTLYSSGGKVINTKSGQAPVAREHVDPSSLRWLPWLWYYTAVAATRSISACDFVGESLANFFGITSPKYQYAIDEYYREIADEEEDKAREQRERQATAANATTVSRQPLASSSPSPTRYGSDQTEKAFVQLDPTKLTS